jgi:hypothetical protein
MTSSNFSKKNIPIYEHEFIKFVVFKQIINSMPIKKNVLVIGIDPKCIDFSSPEFSTMPGLTKEKVFAGITNAVDALNKSGYEAKACWIDLGETAKEVIKQDLQKKTFDAVVIGAGIRKPDSNFMLFERIINIVHKYAPDASICFNTVPTDTIQAVQRWVSIE